MYIFTHIHRWQIIDYLHIWAYVYVRMCVCVRMYMYTSYVYVINDLYIYRRCFVIDDSTTQHDMSMCIYMYISMYSIQPSIIKLIFGKWVLSVGLICRKRVLVALPVCGKRHRNYRAPLQKESVRCAQGEQRAQPGFKNEMWTTINVRNKSRTHRAYLQKETSWL